MKKKIILSNLMVVIVAMLLLFTIGLITVNETNKKSTEDEINNYLNLTCIYFDGTNSTETLEYVKTIDDDIRITIISEEGSVIIDSGTTEELESHLSRPEIQDLGTMYSRYSATLHEKMIYLARLDSGYFVRLSIPATIAKSELNTYLVISIISIIIILAVSIAVSAVSTTKMVAPFNEVVKGLGQVVGKTNYYGLNSVEEAVNEINEINANINDKILALEAEQEKINNIIDSINEGVVVINKEKKVSLINTIACKMFEFTKQDIVDKNYLYLTRSEELQTYIEKSLKDDKKHTIDIDIKEKTYAITASKLFNEIENTGIVIVFIDVTEQKRVEEMKAEFFANASHELKSPLTTIIGSQQMIDQGIIDSGQDIKEAARITIQEANRMNKLVSDMLEISRLESDKNPNKVNVDIKKMITDVLDTHKNQIKSKRIQVFTNLQDVTLKMDNDHATQLINNLIDNAIKYNKTEGTLVIELTTERFVVKDSGVGISLPHQQRVFERFYRVDRGKNRATGSTGLGLSIVKHVCVLYDYKITLESEINKGTKITVEF